MQWTGVKIKIKHDSHEQTNETKLKLTQIHERTHTNTYTRLQNWQIKRFSVQFQQKNWQQQQQQQLRISSLKKLSSEYLNVGVSRRFCFSDYSCSHVRCVLWWKKNRCNSLFFERFENYWNVAGSKAIIQSNDYVMRAKTGCGWKVAKYILG